ncbi:MAG: DNRLRE domain-containing protein, partial [Patescibacteria group bacterium]
MKKQINRCISNDFYLLVSSIQKRVAKFVAFLLVICTIASACLPRNQVLGYTYDFANETTPTVENSADYSKYGTTTTSEFDMSAVAIDKEIESLRTADSKIFRRVDGTYVVAVYDTVVHYKEDGVYKDIDNSLEYDTKTGSYRTKANQISVSLPSSIKEDTFVSVSTGEVGVKWTLLGSSRAAIATTPKDAVSDDKLVLNDISSKATFVGVKENVTLEYIVNGMTIKENIILARYEKDFSIGFRYELTGLSLTQDEAGSWKFVDGSGKDIFTLDALWMSDSKGEVSENVGLSVREIGVGVYEVTITPDDAWLSSAAYPVTIDPSLSSATVSMTVEDAYVYSALPNSTYYTQSYLKLAGTSETSFYKSLLKFSLPSQLSGRKVTYAHMYLTSYTKTTGRELVVLENNAGFTTSSVTWNNAPDATSIVDYHITGDSNTYIFDITDPVARWNEGVSTNYGFTLKDKQICGANNYVRSTEYSGTTTDPTIVIGYVDQSGLKDYWTYQSQSAGRAGTGYVADYTGMMTWVRNDITFETAKQSFGLTMVYNVFDRIGSMGYGSGWQTNYNMIVALDSGSNRYYVTDSTGYKEYFAIFPTAVSTGLSEALQTLAGDFGEFYGSEDGNGNILIKRCPSVPGTATAYYLFTQEYVLYKFLTNASGVWYLDQIISNYLMANPLETTITRVANFPNRVDQVRDDSGNYIDIDYNVNGQISRATLYIRLEDDYEYNEVHDALMKVEYAYAWNSVVNTYTLSTASYFWDYNANGFSATADEVVNYGYDASARLYQAYMADKEKITYAFDANSRVSTISAYYDASLFSTVTYDYSFRKTEISDQDGNFVIMKFDAYGHTVNTTDSQGVTNAYEYLNLFKNYVLDENEEILEIVRYQDGSPNYQNNHKQIASSTPQTTDLNSVVNSGFEYFVPTTFENWTYTSIYGSHYYGVSYDSLYGLYAMAISTASTPAVGYFYQSITLDRGSYTLCTYAKKSSPTSTSGSVYAEISGASMSSPSEKADNNVDWQQLQQYFTIASDNTTVQIRLYTNGSSTTGYFDSVQIKEGFVTESHQMLDNASFEQIRWSSVPGWSLFGSGVSRVSTTYDEIIYGELLGSLGLQIIGDVFSDQGAVVGYDFEISEGETGGEVTIGAWAKTEGTPLSSMEDDAYDRLFCIRVMAFTSDGGWLVESTDIRFDPTIEGWQYNFGSIPITEDVDYLQIELLYQGEGTVWFDGVQITYQPAFNRTEYDKFGRVVEYIKTNGEVIKYVYSTQSADDRTPHQIYVNDVLQTTIESEWGSIESLATANVGVSFDYNESGQRTTTTLGGVSQASTTYVTSAFNQYTNVETDEFGNSTTYHNDVITGLLEAIENAAGQDTHYIYDDEGKLVRVESKSDYANSYDTPDACVIYGYDGLDRLEHIVMGCEEDGAYYYEIHYDDSGRMDNVRVVTASTTFDLMSYVYDDEGSYAAGRIDTQTYGNEDNLQFSYDIQNRLNEVRYYSDSDILQKRFGYEYDSLGNLTVYSMYSSTSTLLDREFYQYDEDNQLVKTVDKDGNVIHYVYDNGKLISMDFEFSGETLESVYNIDDSGQLQSSSFLYMSSAVGTLTRTYEQSGLYRLDHLRLITGSRNIQMQYSYETNSIRIGSVAIDIGEDATNEHTVLYEYDELGNIDQIRYLELGVEVRKYNYTYDALNRLSIEKIYANDNTCTQASDTCYSNLYQYDERGNLLAVLKYKYSEVPTVTSVPNYQYVNDSPFPVGIKWNGQNQPNDIDYLQLYNSPSLSFVFYDPSTGTPYTGVTVTQTGGNLDMTRTGYY